MYGEKYILVTLYQRLKDKNNHFFQSMLSYHRDKMSATVFDE